MKRCWAPSLTLFARQRWKDRSTSPRGTSSAQTTTLLCCSAGLAHPDYRGAVRTAAAFDLEQTHRTGKCRVHRLADRVPIILRQVPVGTTKWQQRRSAFRCRCDAAYDFRRLLRVESRSHRARRSNHQGGGNGRRTVRHNVNGSAVMNSAASQEHESEPTGYEKVDSNISCMLTRFELRSAWSIIRFYRFFRAIRRQSASIPGLLEDGVPVRKCPHLLHVVALARRRSHLRLQYSRRRSHCSRKLVLPSSAHRRLRHAIVVSPIPPVGRQSVQPSVGFLQYPEFSEFMRFNSRDSSKCRVTFNSSFSSSSD